MSMHPDRQAALASRKRSRSRSPPPWKQQRKHPRNEDGGASQRGGFAGRPKQQNFIREQMHANQTRDAEQMEEWVSQEDAFVLKQAKKKAELRVREGRAKAIDWLAVTLRLIDSERSLLDDELSDSDIDIVDPDGVFEGLSDSELADLEKDIDHYLALETNKQNKEFWTTMKIICKDRRQRSQPVARESRTVSAVATDIDRLLSPKSYDALDGLEKQIRAKLRSDEPIDVDYWEQLLQSLIVWKARAKLKNVYQSAIETRLQSLREQQSSEAAIIRSKLKLILGDSPGVLENAEDSASASIKEVTNEPRKLPWSRSLDPEPLLKLRPEDKALQNIEEREFLANVTAERRKVLKLGFVPLRHRGGDKSLGTLTQNPAGRPADAGGFNASVNDDFSQATRALYEREVARGVNENEEIFNDEQEVMTSSKQQWSGKHRPRKPRYFNRVQMGYEWNKYNQTHYDHDNPPPKVVQGYKFNVFYPDLIEKSKAPTYRIERENGRRRGESFAPAGEEDTCLIRFVAGPPYEDIAFRIVDKEWDYSAKRERGFKSSFDKGILQLHFQFKKIYYRK